MKKVISSIIIALLLLTSVLAISASAAGLTATVSKKSCAREGTVTLDVTLSQSVKVKDGAVTVAFDSSVLELVSAEWKISSAILTTYDKDTNLGAFAFNGSGNVSGKIFSITFKVKKDAPLKETAVKCDIQLRDENSSQISLSNVSGSVNVTCKHDFSKKDDKHQASSASCTAPASYYYSCTVCGEKGSKTYTVGSPNAHTYDKQIATRDFLVDADTKCVEKATYYYSCACGAKGSETFEGDASWSHVFTDAWYITASGHYRACVDCGQKKDSSGHVKSEKGICAVCCFVIEEGEEHVHIYGESWEKNGVGHWHECECGARESLDFHNWDKGVVIKEASENSEGSKKFVCNVCKAEKTEPIPKVEVEEEPGDNTQNPPEQNDETPSSPAEPAGPSPILVAAITLGAVAVIEVIVFVIIKAAKGKKAPSTEKEEEKEEPKDDESK